METRKTGKSRRLYAAVVYKDRESGSLYGEIVSKPSLERTAKALDLTLCYDRETAERQLIHRFRHGRWNWSYKANGWGDIA